MLNWVSRLFYVSVHDLLLWLIWFLLFFLLFLFFLLLLLPLFFFVFLFFVLSFFSSFSCFVAFFSCFCITITKIIPVFLAGAFVGCVDVWITRSWDADAPHSESSLSTRLCFGWMWWRRVGWLISLGILTAVILPYRCPSKAKRAEPLVKASLENSRPGLLCARAPSETQASTAEAGKLNMTGPPTWNSC